MKKYISIRTKGLGEKGIFKHLPLIAILMLTLMWEVSVRIFKVPNYILPGPSAIIKVFSSMWKLILSHSVVTLYEAMAGLSVSIIVAMVLSFLMDRWVIIRRVLYPMLVISQTVPIIALAPLMLIWFGVGIFPKILIVVLVCFFPICVNTVEGLRSADRDMINLMKVMKAGHLKIFMEVNLPSALPQFFAGLKIAATYSIMGAVIGEWLGAKSGLGIFMTRATSSYRADMLFAAIVVIVLLSIGVFKIIELLERLFIPWNFKRKKDL